MITILTIAGSDPSGGAGIQADLKTIAANGGYGLSVITALTTQNSQGVQSIFEVPSSVIESQFKALLEDFHIDVIKIGMLHSIESIMIVSELLEMCDISVVLDPILSSSHGDELLQKEAIDALQTHLFPKVHLLTPNIPEAQILTGKEIKSVADMKAACKEIWAENILLKGGHLEGNILEDVLYTDGEFHTFKHRKIQSNNTHGTGCTLSSAIATHLAQKKPLVEAVEAGIAYVKKAIIESYPTGKGRGSLNHFYMLRER